MGRVGDEDDGAYPVESMKEGLCVAHRQNDQWLIVSRLDIQESALSTSRRAPAATAAILLLRSESVRNFSLLLRAVRGSAGYADGKLTRFLQTTGARRRSDARPPAPAV